MVKDQESSCDEEMQVDQGNGDDGAKIGNNDYEPYKFSGKNFTLDLTVHKGILRNLRKWVLSYLGSNQCI